ncbi:MAG: nuclear transport factor 2 family protein [Bryobacterales bacterium]|nr:nuclear transport factor 2 family protein [Bryobacterales bacterium]
MSPETHAIEQFFQAINRNDMQAITKDFHPQIVRTEPEDFPSAATYHGIGDVRHNVTRGRSSWAEGTCEPEQFFQNGNKVVVFLHAWVRLHNATEWTGGRFADGFEFSDGKIVQYLTFLSRARALDWAGIQNID